MPVAASALPDKVAVPNFPATGMSSPHPLRFHRYVALGDSSTEGVDDPDGNGGYQGWSRRLAAMIDAAQDGGLLYANLGVRGLTTAEVRATQLAPALALRPDLATVFCGTNDVTALRFDARQVGDDLEHLQRALRDAGATVLSFTLPDLTPLMPIARLIAPRIAALNRIMTATSRRTGSLLVDFAAQPVATDARLWSADRIHANSAGHARIAEALAHALGLPGGNSRWQRPLPAAPAPSRWEACAAEARWIRQHLLPWLWDGLRAGHGTVARPPAQPQLAPVPGAQPQRGAAPAIAASAGR